MNSRPPEPLGREALYALADSYLAALAARDPSRLPWAEEVAFSENNVLLMIGDGLNDIELIQFSGLGIAMANACPEVAAVADKTTADHDADGVAAAVECILNGAW